MGEVAGDTSRSAAQAVGASYTGGPLLLAGTYTKKETATGFDNKAYVVGGGYKFGELQFKAGYSNEEQATAAAGDFENNVAWAGASYQLSPALELTAAYYRSKFESRTTTGTRNLAIVGAAYALSKRTNLYAEVDLNRYKGALIPASTQTRQTGFSAGVMHLF
ncbi:hypothetical protein AYR66_24985 [Noviherbaspirillum denitrificans]|uniref:Porin domain-containing protein n=1 Tax=Noviherbaspirillum denitrificans TaxID=1968433 RepID=A0A254TI01_9BURK|nr:hypothetical protein AYR66_24985 [Noviherbaspirillum denitrificans]